MLTDETGRPKDSQAEVSDWRRYDAAKLRELAVAAWPGETVLGVEWASEPRRYSPVATQVLLVRCAGVVEVRSDARRARDAVADALRRMRRVESEDLEMADAIEMMGHRAYRAGERTRLPGSGGAPALPVVVLDDVAVINTCRACGTAYTAKTWAALLLVGAKEHVEGATVIHEDYRNCACGSTRMVFTTRAKSEAA